jgi:hypothetical protein
MPAEDADRQDTVDHTVDQAGGSTVPRNEAAGLVVRTV